MRSFIKANLIKLSISIIILIASTVVSQASNSSNADWDKKNQKIVNGPRAKVDKNQVVQIAKKLKQTVGISAVKNGNKYYQSQLGQVLRNQRNNTINFSNVMRGLNAPTGTVVKWHEKNGTPVFVSGSGLKVFTKSAAPTTSIDETALAFIESNKELFRLESPSEELFLIEKLQDRLGKRHVKFGQSYQGIKVWGSDLVVHFDEDRQLYFVNARYSPTPTKIDFVLDRISPEEAIGIASDALSGKEVIQDLSQSVKNLLNYEKPPAELFIWIDADTQKTYLAWQVEIRPNIRDDWYYFVDAHSGEILQKYNNTKTDGPAVATANDLNSVSRTINTYQVGATYYLIDGSRSIWVPGQTNIPNSPLGALWTKTANFTDNGPIANITSSSNVWNDATSVSAHYNVAQTYAYFFATFGREAIDGSGTTITSIIHVTYNGQPWENAGWGAPIMYYGDGGNRFKPLAGALDVAAHEMTHGVIDYTVELFYQFQSGALNESFADVFGCMVDRADWLIGEDIAKLSWFSSGAMRDMSDPHNGGSIYGDHGWQPAHMNEYIILPGDDDLDHDNGGVHVNSGIPNRAAYLIGSTIGKDKLEQIYYRILDARYLNSHATFVDMRRAAIQSATDIYGALSNEVDVIKSAFSAVGIFDGPATEPPPDVPPVTGEEWIAAVNAEATDNSLYRISPDLVSPIIDQLTTTQVFSITGCPITADREGTFLVFVDAANFLRAISTDGTGEQVISATGEWWSVALSPDGTKLAATSIYIDTSIYIFDFVNPDSSKILHLYSPTTSEGVTSSTVLYADALDWNLTGEFVLYDGYNSIPQQGAGAISYWDVNIIDFKSEQIFQVFAPLPQGLSIGNPAFASTNDIFFAFDILNENTGTTFFAGTNLFNVQSVVIESNGTSAGYPDYSPDDSRMVFQREVSGIKTLRQIQMSSDKINPVGPSVPWITEGSLPTWFVIKQGCCVGVRGDLNGDGIESNILDLTFMINDIYRGGPSASCPEEADVDGNSTPANVLDLTYMINDIFRGGPNSPSCL